MQSLRTGAALWSVGAALFYLFQCANSVLGSSESKAVGSASASNGPSLRELNRDPLQGDSLPDSIGGSGLEFLATTDRSQEITRHRTETSEELKSVSESLLQEDEITSSTPEALIWSWNPLKAGDRTEAEDLEHKGVPSDYTEIPILDKAAEQQSNPSTTTQGSVEVSSDTSQAPEADEDRGSKDAESNRLITQVSLLAEDTSTKSKGAGGYSLKFQQIVKEGRRKPRSPAVLRSDGQEGEVHSPSSEGEDGNDASTRTPQSLVSDDSGHDRETKGETDDSALAEERLDIDGGDGIESTNPESPATGNNNEGSGGGSAQPEPSSSPKVGQKSEATSGFSEEPQESYQGKEGHRSLPVVGSGESSGNSQSYSEQSSGAAPTKTSCKVAVGGVIVDASYVDSACTGQINLMYKTKQSKFLERRMLLTNTTGKRLTVVMKTVNARLTSPASQAWAYSHLQVGPASFLQGVSEGETSETAKEYVHQILKQMRRQRRKRPDDPLDLVVSFASPFDNPGAAAGAVSFMQTEAGAARITQTCQELLAVVEDSQSYSCEILDAVDMVILQFPPNADISADGAVYKLLSKLLVLEGKSILFWELSKPTSLQMVPVNEALPEPLPQLFEKPAFVQARAELKERCSAKVTAQTHLLSDDSPVSSRIPTDPDLEKRLWGMYAARCVHAWMHGEKGHKDVVVAVVDSGVAKHYDIDSNVWKNLEESDDGKDDDGNGLVDDIEGWNFAENTNVIADLNGHGTHVAGTIGGVANGRDVVGCAPLVSLMKVQQFGSSGRGSVSDAVRGMAYAMLKGVHVINNSWGSTESTYSLQLVIERSRHMREGLGILIVNAAGNSSTNNDIEPFYPAAYDYQNTISVGAYDADGQLASFSNYGEASVSLLAPGDRIYSTYLDNGFTFLSGTSMATPHVSGIAALVFGVFMKANSEVTAAEVKDIIHATLLDLPAAKGVTQWGGAPDAMSAVLMARMGGMWFQMKCTDMIVDLQPEEVYASTIYIRGYAEGIYTAEIQVEVYDEEANMLGSAQIPVRLNSSSNPATNSPSDETAASAFSSHVSEKDQGTPLCDVQMKYTGTLEDGDGWSEGEIAALTLGCLAIVAGAACIIFYFRYKAKQPGEGPSRPKAVDRKEFGEPDAMTALLQDD